MADSAANLKVCRTGDGPPAVRLLKCPAYASLLVLMRSSGDGTRTRRVNLAFLASVASRFMASASSPTQSGSFSVDCIFFACLVVLACGVGFYECSAPWGCYGACLLVCYATTGC